MSYLLTDQKTIDGLTIVRRWRCDCWHCNPMRHPKPADVIAREEAAKAARPAMPEHVKEILRERSREKRATLPKKPKPDEAQKLARYGPLRSVKKIIDHTKGGCPQVLLVCGHNKTVHHDQVKEARCVRCKPGRMK